MRTVTLLCLSLASGLSGLSGVASAQVDAKTQRAWKAKCSACHGEDGKGQTDAGKKVGVSDMSQAAWQKKTTDEQMKTAITKGIKEKRDGRDVEMAAFPELKAADVDALVKLVRSYSK